jgi:hypothetical protein
MEVASPPVIPSCLLLETDKNCENERKSNQNSLRHGCYASPCGMRILQAHDEILVVTVTTVGEGDGHGKLDANCQCLFYLHRR